MKVNHIYHGEASEVLKKLPDSCIDMVMTSPPYWALRDYGVKKQLGLESAFDEYINSLCNIFDEIKRTLKETGTVWVNLGDTYAGSGITSPHHKNISELEKKKVMANAMPQKEVKPKWNKLNYPTKSLVMIPFRFAIEMVNRGWILRNLIIWHKPNCLPSSVKDRFTVDFEYLFLFSKKKQYYFEQQFDKKAYPTKRVKELAESIYKKAKVMRDGELYNSKYSKDKKTQALGVQEFIVSTRKVGKEVLKTTKLLKKEKTFLKNWIQNGSGYLQGRNKRCIWRITTKPFKEAHFAVYPEAICETPINAGCPKYICKKCGKPREKIIERKSKYQMNIRVRDVKKGRIKHTDRKASQKEIDNYQEKIVEGTRKFKGWTDCGCNAGFEPGVVLDPFFGSGTTGLVALKQNKNFVGIELNSEYIKIAKKRLEPYLKW